MRRRSSSVICSVSETRRSDLRHIGYDIEASRSFNTIFSARFTCHSLFLGFILDRLLL
jgi:hypothetical protein